MSKLPPLPDPEGMTDRERGYSLRQYTPVQMLDYAAAAVAAVRAELDAPQRAPLTNEQIEDVFFGMRQFAKVDLKEFARAIERAHGIT